MGTDTQRAGYTIDIDVPCNQCGYNLLGLEAAGRCPECGRPVGASLVYGKSSLFARERLRNADPEWIKRVSEGASYVGIAGVAWLTLHLMPDRMFDYESAYGRRAMLVLACIAWVCTWWGLVRLSSKPSRAFATIGERLWRYALMISITIYSCWPAYFGILNYWDSQYQFHGVPGHLSLISGVVASVAAHQVFRSLAIRLPSALLPGQFYFLSMLCGMMVILLPSFRVSYRGHRDGGLELIAWMMSPIFGPHGYIRELFESSRGFNDPFRLLLILLVVVVPIWTFALSLILAARLRNEYRAARLQGGSVPDFH